MIVDIDMGAKVGGNGAAASTAAPATAIASAGTLPAYSSRRMALLNQLSRRTFFNVFAFIEMFTVVYVWGELRYPPVFCGATRPLSLYYYPIALSMLDLIKFNIYVAVEHWKSGCHLDAALAPLNLEMFITNLWVTAALSVMFVVGVLTDLCRATKSLGGSICGTSSDSGDSGGVFAAAINPVWASSASVSAPQEEAQKSIRVKSVNDDNSGHGLAMGAVKTARWDIEKERGSEHSVEKGEKGVDGRPASLVDQDHA